MIHVIASLAQDIIVYKQQTLLWGPGHYLDQILKHLKSDFVLTTSEQPCKVIIDRDEHGNDFGIIDSVYPLKVRKLDTNPTSIILSSVLNEIQIKDFNEVDSSLFIDIQWFVRNKSGGGKIMQQKFAVGSKMTVYKCTKEEYSYVNPQLLSTACVNKNIYFIITHWGDGIDIYNGGVSIYHVQEDKLNISDTIGAGDIFLWACVHYFDLWHTLLDSVQYWSEQAREFLLRKNYLWA